MKDIQKKAPPPQPYFLLHLVRLRIHVLWPEFQHQEPRGNIYLNVFYLGLVDFPAAVSGIYFSKSWGRGRALTGTLSLSSLILGARVFAKVGYQGSQPWVEVLQGFMQP